MNKRIIKSSLFSLLAVAVVIGLSGCLGTTEEVQTDVDSSVQKNESMEKEQKMMKEMEDEKMTDDVTMEEGMDIVDIAIGSKDHTTLVAAVQAADLDETLKSVGPFTVFAPVNDAFDALPAGTVDDLLMPENKEQLVGVLTYHVVPSKVMSTDVVEAIVANGGSFKVKTVSGGMLTFKNDNGIVTVTDENGGIANVIASDLDGSNGVIHVIDAVLLPHSG